MRTILVGLLAGSSTTALDGLRNVVGGVPVTDVR
jgi:hypothetical protein